jgi:polar amino acid transport system substrate-binding protein
MLLRLLSFLPFFLFSSAAVAMQQETAQTLVKVGGYEFEPFVEKGQGITPAIVTLLNDLQSEYKFEFVSIPAQRRYSLMEGGKIDAVFFEMQRWGWENHQEHVETTRPLIKASEAFFALKANPEGERVFADIKNKQLALTLGYHYAFADFNADQDYISERFNARFAPSQRVALRLMLAGSTDLVILSDIFLYREMARNPALKGQVIRAPKVDQEYALPLMVRKNGPITAARLEKCLDKLEKSGALAAFFADFGSASLLISKK